VSDEGKRKEIQALQADLTKSGLSRRAFLDRLKGLGVGFGAAFILGVNEDAAAKDAGAPSPADGLSLKSRNPALDEIISEGQEDRRGPSSDPANSVESETKFAETSNKFSKYNKYSKKYDRYSKEYSKGYTKYSKGYDKYSKGYTKYSKGYDKYSKGYTKYSKSYDKYTKYARYSKGLPTR
jgi:hypothetical protein